MECMKELFRLKSMKEVGKFMQGKLASVSQTQYTQLQRMIKERKQGILAKYKIDFIVCVVQDGEVIVLMIDHCYMSVDIVMIML